MGNREKKKRSILLWCRKVSGDVRIASVRIEAGKDSKASNSNGKVKVMEGGKIIRNVNDENREVGKEIVLSGQRFVERRRRAKKSDSSSGKRGKWQETGSMAPCCLIRT